MMDNNTTALHEEIVTVCQEVAGLQDRLNAVKNDLTDQITQVEESMNAMNIIISKVCILRA